MAAIVIVLGVVAGLMVMGKLKRDRLAALEKSQAAKIAVAVDQIQVANVGLPELQVQAKALIFAALIQKKIPLAATWCETLNMDGKLWPATPTNTFFALNSAVAGRVYSKTNRVHGDTVVFFETASPGWNLAGGSGLMASRLEGVAVAFADGRSSIMTPGEAAKLRWTP